ncbi:hypothetical protein R4B61_00740 [Fructilactobacillus vespulae]|uniref:hypothetical protein n=1 Tax=Fructilactobacillus vespulae TaxID=1249630 RepID=UPI0039B5B892
MVETNKKEYNNYLLNIVKETIMFDFGNNVLTIFIFLTVALVGLPLLIGVICHYLAGFVQRYLVNNFSFKSQYWIGGLGVIIHELGHAIFCIIFGHQIQSLKLLNFKHPEDGSLGSVSNSYNRNSWYQSMGSFFIGLAPLFSGLFVFWLLIKFICKPDYSTLYLNTLTPYNLNLVDFFTVVFNNTFTWLGNIWQGFSQAGIFSQLLILILIGVISTTVFSLSTEDLNSSYSGITRFLEVVLVLSLVGGLVQMVMFTLIFSIKKIIITIAALWIVFLILILICLLISFIEIMLVSWIRQFFVR